mmetsp:Transcript_11106/g.42858  ORF Transcript_11106/g.42858 Transcript_11106/m.42858 type:complete len:236 (+) Transcript_11106:2747-3454(+)
MRRHHEVFDSLTATTNSVSFRAGACPCWDMVCEPPRTGDAWLTCPVADFAGDVRPDDDLGVGREPLGGLPRWAGSDTRGARPSSRLGLDAVWRGCLWPFPAGTVAKSVMVARAVGGSEAMPWLEKAPVFLLVSRCTVCEPSSLGPRSAGGDSRGWRPLLPGPAVASAMGLGDSLILPSAGARTDRVPVRSRREPLSSSLLRGGGRGPGAMVVPDGAGLCLTGGGGEGRFVGRFRG